MTSGSLCRRTSSSASPAVKGLKISRAVSMRHTLISGPAPLDRISPLAVQLAALADVHRLADAHDLPEAVGDGHGQAHAAVRAGPRGHLPRAVHGHPAHEVERVVHRAQRALRPASGALVDAEVADRGDGLAAAAALAETHPGARRGVRDQHRLVTAVDGQELPAQVDLHPVGRPALHQRADLPGLVELPQYGRVHDIRGPHSMALAQSPYREAGLLVVYAGRLGEEITALT